MYGGITMSNSNRDFDKTQEPQGRKPQHVKHPSSNTDASSTKGSVGSISACVDWLAFTVKGDDDEDFDWNDPRYVVEWLGFNPYEGVSMPRGYEGHPNGMQLGPGVTVSWGGVTKVWKKGVVVKDVPKGQADDFMEEVSMGIFVQLTGQGCRYFEQVVKRDWIEVLAGVVSVASNVARIDLALDDRIGLLQPMVIQDAIERGQYVGKLKTKGYDGSGKLHQMGTAWSVYLGSPKSGFRIRFYDKAAEQAIKGKPVEGHWVRCELQIRDKRAIKSINELVRGGDLGRVATGILREYVDFRTAAAGSLDSNKSRWSTVTWWSAFVLEVEKVKLTVGGVVARTIDQVESWFDTYVTPNLAVLFEYWSGDMNKLIGKLDRGRARWGTKHRLLLQTASMSTT